MKLVETLACVYWVKLDIEKANGSVENSYKMLLSVHFLISTVFCHSKLAIFAKKNLTLYTIEKEMLPWLSSRAYLYNVPV